MGDRDFSFGGWIVRGAYLSGVVDFYEMFDNIITIHKPKKDNWLKPKELTRFLD